MLKKLFCIVHEKTILVKNSHSMNSQILLVHIGNFNVYQPHMKKIENSFEINIYHAFCLCQYTTR